MATPSEAAVRAARENFHQGWCLNAESGCKGNCNLEQALNTVIGAAVAAEHARAERLAQELKDAVRAGFDLDDLILTVRACVSQWEAGR